MQLFLFPFFFLFSSYSLLFFSAHLSATNSISSWTAIRWRECTEIRGLVMLYDHPCKTMERSVGFTSVHRWIVVIYRAIIVNPDSVSVLRVFLFYEFLAVSKNILDSSVP